MVELILILSSLTNLEKATEELVKHETWYPHSKTQLLKDALYLRIKKNRTKEDIEVFYKAKKFVYIQNWERRKAYGKAIDEFIRGLENVHKEN